MTAPESLGHCHRSGSFSAFSKRKRSGAVFAAAVAIVPLWTTYVYATDFYTGPSGDWNTGSNWSTGQPPTSGAAATLNGNGGNVVVTMDATIATNVGGVTIGTSSGSVTLVVSGTSQLTAFDISAGVYGTGQYVQSGGTVILTASGDSASFLLGSNNGTSVGSGTMSAGTLSIPSGNMEIGWGGTGSLNQTGGNLNVGNSEYIGAYYIGVGTGTYSQSGGSNIVSGFGSAVYLGFSSSSSGSYTLSGGVLSSTNGMYIGYSGLGSFTQTGGTNIAGNPASYSNGLYLGFNTGSVGSYSFSGGLLTATNGIYAGYSGTGSLTQSGGTINLGQGGIVLGDFYNGNGSYSLSNGVLTVGANLWVGQAGNGTFTQSGGSMTAGSYTNSTGLYLGANFTNRGTYTLSGGLLTADRGTYVGCGGTGVFTQSGGSNFTGQLYLGYSGSASGSYSLTNGLLSVSFTVPGVSQVIAGEMYLGESQKSVGTFTLGGSGSVQAGTELIGDYGTGHFVQTGGFNSVSGSLYLSNMIGSVGSYAMGGGTLYVATTYVGNGSNGTFNLSGGTFTTNSITVIYDGNFSQTASSSVLNAALFIQGGGTVSGTIQNQGTYRYEGGTFNGQLINQGSITQSANWTCSNGIYNQSVTPMSISGYSLTLNGAGLLRASKNAPCHDRRLRPMYSV